MNEDYLKSFAEYSNNAEISGLWDWQAVIACSTLYLLYHLNSNVLVEVPTGHGKSVLICAIARAIYDRNPSQQIFITTQTSYLKHHLCIKHGEKQISVAFPSHGDKRQRITFIKFDELVQIPQKVLSQSIVIVDEIDQSYVEHFYNIDNQDGDR